MPRPGAEAIWSFSRRGLYLITPPIVGRLIAKLRAVKESPNEWEYAGETWPPIGGMRGWNVESVVQRQLADWDRLAHAAASTDVLSNGGVTAHNTLMCFAYVLGRVATGHPRLTVLDWGGGLGQYGLLARGMYPDLDIDYHCRDLPLMADAGRRVSPNTAFYDNDADAFARTYDLVVASSSLQYAEDWRRTLADLAGASSHYLFVTRQPFVAKVQAYVAVQRPRAYGYDTEYPGWVLNRDEFLESTTQLGLQLRREFITGEEPRIPGAPEQPVYRGFLFERPAH